MSKSGAKYLLGVYLSIAPVYWFPGIRVQSMEIVKYGVVLAAVLFVVSSAVIRKISVSIPKGMYGVQGLLLFMLLPIPSLLYASSEAVNSYFLDVGTSLVGLWVFYVVVRYIGVKDSLDVLFWSSVIIGILCGIVSLDYIWGGQLVGGGYSGKPLYYTGFALKRGAWSNAITFYALPLVAVLSKQGDVFGRKSSLYSLFLVPIILNHWLNSSRNGLITTIIASLFVISILSRRIVLLLTITLIFVYISTVDLQVLSRFRLTSLATERITYETIDIATSRRLTLIEKGISLFKQRPLLGSGYNTEIKTQLGKTTLHNTYLKMMVENGILFFMFFIAWIWTVFRDATKVYAYGMPYMIPVIIIMQGFLLAMNAPGFPFVAFNTACIWWFSLAIILGSSKVSSVSYFN
jgi:O-antigen ligase